MLYGKTISVMLLPATLYLLTGCSSTYFVPTDELKPEGEVVRGVLTLKGEDVSFDERAVVESDTIAAQVDGKPYLVTLGQVEQVKVQRGDSGKTVALVVVVVATVAAVVGLAALIVLSTMPDCLHPFCNFGG